MEQLRQAKTEQLHRYKSLQSGLHDISVEQLESRRSSLLEAKLRTDLLDRLIFYTDSHYKNQDERVFLKDATAKLAERELNDPEHMNASLWKFLKYLSNVYEDARGSDLSAVAILNSYLAYSSILQPKDPKNYLKSRDYTNGSEFETAHTVSRENVGDTPVAVVAPSAPGTSSGPAVATRAIMGDDARAQVTGGLQKPVLKPAMIYEDGSKAPEMSR